VSRVKPKKALGQHFLVDPNVLGVIDRLAAPGEDDVVLEIGPGLGVLTRHLAERVACVHAVEVDRSLAPRLEDALAGLENVRLHWGDALRLDLASFDPAPTALVANLPYNVATPIVVETLVGVPAIARWCVMVQREVADRFVARPGTKAYGAVSVIVQLLSERTGFHPISRHVFRPEPRVESALVALRRRAAPDRVAAIRRLVDAAFAHRRKTLANALALAGVAGREEASAALRSLGRAADVRAEALAPDEFVALEAALRG
jgi:16S rRNA (adenine1518-N6/adenine1519-N6)-dimethyltransferase